MEKIINEPIKEIWSQITGVSSPITSFAQSILSSLFGTSKPKQHQQKNSFWHTAYCISLAAFLFFAYELLIKPGIEQTALYLWLKNLPTTCYFLFLTLSWPIKITVGLSILFAIGLALHAKTSRDEEARTAENQAKNLSEQKQQQHQDDMLKVTQKTHKLDLTVKKLENELTRTHIQMAGIQRRHAIQLAKKNQLDQIRFQHSLPPLSPTILKNSEILAEQHTLGKLLTDKIAESLESIPAPQCLISLAAHIDNIKNAMAAISTQEKTKAMTHALDLLNLCHTIVAHIKQRDYPEAKKQIDNAKTSTARYGQSSPLLTELEQLVTHLDNNTAQSDTNQSAPQDDTPGSANTNNHNHTMDTPGSLPNLIRNGLFFSHSTPIPPAELGCTIC